MKEVRTVVNGALGRMGQVLTGTLNRESGIRLVGAVDVKAKDGFLPAPEGVAPVPLSADLDRLLSEVKPDVMVDFTVAAAVMPAARTATAHKVNLVIGTTGLKPDVLAEIDSLAKANGVGAFVAPNFALGAVLMVHLAKIASKFMDSVEIIELHHDQKMDAPSGTAISTAREIEKARGKPFNRPAEKQSFASRGEVYGSINVHSVRLPGLMAHQEVIFGGLGKTLSIRHDSINRDCFMPGVIIAVREVGNHKGLVYGLDKLLGLE